MTSASRMARVDWCIVPSIWWEIFGLVISEAWMFGKPVICSNRGGPGERVRHDLDGLQFQLGDPRSLAEMMQRAATEDGLWERLCGELAGAAIAAGDGGGVFGTVSPRSGLRAWEKHENWRKS